MMKVGLALDGIDYYLKYLPCLSIVVDNGLRNLERCFILVND